MSTHELSRRTLLGAAVTAPLLLARPGRAPVVRVRPRVSWPSTAAGWRSLFDDQPIHGDGMISVRLDARRVAFLTGDAMPREPGPWAHSTITLIVDGVAHVVQGQTDAESPYQLVPDDPDGACHWLGPAFATNGVLRSLAPHIRPDATSGFGFVSLGTDWARFDIRSEPRFTSLTATPWVTDAVHWGSGVWHDTSTGWVYVFGVSHDATDGWTGHDVYVARVPAAFAHSDRGWQYLGVPETGWSVNPADARPVMRAVESGGVEGAFAAWRDASGWNVAGRYGGAWGQPRLVCWTAPTLVHGVTWRERTLADLPGDAYLPWVHHTLPLANGQVAATYNQPMRDSTWLGVTLP